mgnify:CR=1 FL=1
MKNEILWNTDIFADMISSNEKIISLCEEVKGALPGFSCLSECGLFTEGLSSIESMTSSLEDSVNGLSQMVKQHNESIASRESKIESLYRDTPFVSLGNVKNFKDYAMGSVPFLVAGAASKYSNVEPTFETTSHETPSSSKSTSTIMTYEEYKKGAQKFAQEHGLPEMSDSDMKESYTSYITKQPIIPKTEMKSMPEREVSTPIQEQNTKNNDLSQDRYYRMKAEQAKDSNFSQSGYEEIKNSENIEPTETPSSSKSTSTIMTYEEYKKGAQKFAQEHGLPEMSDSDMKESYTSYITKQPIIPKTEMKSMPEREVSTPIQEQNTKNNDLSQDRYYRMKAEQTRDSRFSSETFDKAQSDRNHLSDESTRDTGLADNTNNNVKPSIPEDKYTNNNNSYNNNQDFSSTKNSSDLFNDSENSNNIDKNYSNEFDYSKDLNQPTKSYEESQTTIEQVKNNSYQPNDIFVNRNQNNYSTKTTEDIINDISSKDDSIISNTQNNNVIKENNNNYDFKNDNNLNAEVQEQYHENNKNDDWLNGIAGVGVAGLGAFGLNNLLKNKHKKSENDTEDDDE